MEKKQTAVNWLIDTVKNSIAMTQQQVDEVFEVANRMFYQQIKEAYMAGLPLDDNPNYMADKYYVKTYVNNLKTK